MDYSTVQPGSQSVSEAIPCSGAPACLERSLILPQVPLTPKLPGSPFGMGCLLPQVQLLETDLTEPTWGSAVEITEVPEGQLELFLPQRAAHLLRIWTV